MYLISAVLRTAGAVVSPGGSNGYLTILTYHRILPERDPMLPFDQIDAACFDQQMSAVARHFNVLPLGEAVEMMQQGSLPARALSITFDDGYLDNHTIAWPILRRHGLSATFFVSTSFMGDGMMFNDVLTEALRRAQDAQLDLSWLGLGLQPLSGNVQKQALNTQLIKAVKYLSAEERLVASDRLWSQLAGQAPRPRLMMAAEQIQDLSKAGMTIGGHTHTHPILKRIGLEEARQDILTNRNVLREITGQPLNLFAYPNGRPDTDYAREHVQLVKDAGYCAAVTTARGVASAHVDPMQLPRFSPWNLDALRLVAHLLRNAWNGRQPAVA